MAGGGSGPRRAPVRGSLLLLLDEARLYKGTEELRRDAYVAD